MSKPNDIIKNFKVLNFIIQNFVQDNQINIYANTHDNSIKFVANIQELFSYLLIDLSLNALESIQQLKSMSPQNIGYKSRLSQIMSYPKLLDEMQLKYNALVNVPIKIGKIIDNKFFRKELPQFLMKEQHTVQTLLPIIIKILSTEQGLKPIAIELTKALKRISGENQTINHIGEENFTNDHPILVQLLYLHKFFNKTQHLNPNAQSYQSLDFLLKKFQIIPNLLYTKTKEQRLGTELFQTKYLQDKQEKEGWQLNKNKK